MAYVVFPRKYRPQTFADVVGQEAVAETLRRALVQDRVAHAYLFAGPRGVGKTSMARIFAKALNCPAARDGLPCLRCESCRLIAAGRDVDVIEIDGASHRGIEEVRAIREGARFLPTRSRYKVYIVDEVHMLTTPAFNALLKTLEEPPPHVIFLFATTRPEALPETVRSRCQRFDFRPLGEEAIVQRLRQIAAAEALEVEETALAQIARLAEGGMRDAQSLLDQLAAHGEGRIRAADVEALLGLPPGDVCLRILDALAAGEAAAALAEVDGFVRRGGTVELLAERLERLARDCLVIQVGGGETGLPLLGGLPAEAVAPRAAAWPAEALPYLVKLLGEARAAMRRPGPPRVALEVALVRAARLRELKPVAELVAAIERLEAGRPAAGPDPAPPPAGAKGGRGQAPARAAGGGDPQALLEAVARRYPMYRAALEGAAVALEGRTVSVTLAAEHAALRRRLAEALTRAAEGGGVRVEVRVARGGSREGGAEADAESGARKILEMFDGEELGPDHQKGNGG